MRKIVYLRLKKSERKEKAKKRKKRRRTENKATACSLGSPWFSTDYQENKPE